MKVDSCQGAIRNCTFKELVQLRTLKHQKLHIWRILKKCSIKYHYVKIHVHNVTVHISFQTLLPPDPGTKYMLPPKLNLPRHSQGDCCWDFICHRFTPVNIDYDVISLWCLCFTTGGRVSYSQVWDKLVILLLISMTPW